MTEPHILLTNKKLGWNGEVKIVGELAERLPSRGFRVSLATNPKAHVLTRIDTDSLTVVPLELNKKKPGVLRALPRDLRKLADFIRAEQVDLIHSHASFDTWTAALALRRYRLHVPLVRTKHNVKKIRTGAVNRWYYSRAIDYVVAPSRAVLNDVQHSSLVPPDHLRFIPYGIRLDGSETYPGTRAEARKELNLNPNETIIVYVSRLTMRKDPQVLAKAFLRLADQRPELRLVFVGLQDAAVQRELDAIGQGHDRIEYWGQRSDVPAILAAADIFVLPSITEAFGLAPLEAMRQGTPVIVSDAEGFKDFIEDGVNGLMFPARNLDALVDALTRILDDSTLQERLSRAGRESVQDRFNVERMVDDYAALYREILGVTP